MFVFRENIRNTFQNNAVWFNSSTNSEHHKLHSDRFYCFTTGNWCEAVFNNMMAVQRPDVDVI